MKDSHEISFLWLHLKKCGGTSFRDTFTPPYVQTDRSNNYKPFIAIPKAEWNDALNNYRIPLGEYDFRRMLFAKKYLYKEREFSQMYKFAIARNPYDRAVSMFFSLYKPESILDKMQLRYFPRKAFNKFLNRLPEIWNSKENRKVATHTAPIWPDVTDTDGKLLADKLYRLEDSDSYIMELSEILGVRIDSMRHLNKSRKNIDKRGIFTTDSKEAVMKLFGEDIDNLKYSF